MTKKLNPSERDFFNLVSRAAFTNPFSSDRVEIDRKIASAPQNKTWSQMLRGVLQGVEKKIAEMDSKGLVRIQDFEAADHHTMQNVFLFSVFHKFIKQFDELISAQISADGQSLQVPFANDVISLLIKRGINKTFAIRFFSLFYQMRRAFYFINNNLIGTCNSMRQLRMDLWNNIFTHDISYYERYIWDKMEDFSTLLLGPTGCGKGAAAAAIGRSGYINFDEKQNNFAESFTNSFVPINLSQYPESLIESELFGHTKGSFTGAVAAYDGLFALCSRYGTVFLDEIGDVNIQVQIKLLKILEEREFNPVGSHQKKKFHGRVIAATNKSISQLRAQGKFRDDFYYRLCSDCILVPSLSQRIQENPKELDELIAHSVKRITGHTAPDLACAVRQVIDKNLGIDYHWPGNVRELAQCVRSVIIKRNYTGQSQNQPDDIKDCLYAEIESGKINAQDLLANYCAILYKKHKTYEQVAKITQLDRRTAKKYIQQYLEK